MDQNNQILFWSITQDPIITVTYWFEEIEIEIEEPHMIYENNICKK